MRAQPIFRPSFGNRPDRIVGRDDIMQAFDEGLASWPGNRERALLLTGQRGMGKTALLLEMADRAAEADFVPARTTCGEAMLENIVDILQRNGSKLFDEKKPPIKGFNAGALGFSFGLTFTEEARDSHGFRVKLEMICDRLAEIGKGVVILVDEVKPGSPEMRLLATTYQELAGEGKDIAIVMAGLPVVISEVLGEDTLTFLNRATRKKLGLVSIGAVRAYFASAFSREGLAIDDDTLDRAAEATAGFPYLLQLIGYYLVEYAQGSSAIDERTLAEARAAALKDLDENVFGAMLRPLSRADVAFLRAMSEDDGPTRVGELEDRLGVSQGHVQSYRKRLLDAGVIAAPSWGEVAFVIPQLADYLRRTSPGMGR